MRLAVEKKVIYGCEATGDQHNPLFTRYTLLSTHWGNLYLHVFHRSDIRDVLHDHPWSFVSLILWRGYIEETPEGKFRRWPLSLLFRSATWIHRVELVGERPAVTLVWVTRRKREWGFHQAGCWTQWQDYFRINRC